MSRWRGITENKLKKLQVKSIEACENSYCPYSKFEVGASVLASSGKIYTGTNIENASYGLTMCAERVALFSAITSGESEVTALSLYLKCQDHPGYPCGACLQALSEFVLDDLYLIGICNDFSKEYTGFLSELYRDKFTSEKFTLSK